MKIIYLLLLVIAVCLIAFGMSKKIPTTTKTGGTPDNREIEWRFMFEKPSDISKTKDALKKMGAKKRLETLMPIIVYNPAVPDDEDPPYIRVRHEGDRIAFTVKKDTKSEFPKEYEVEVSPDPKNIEQLDLIMKGMGNTVKYRLEKIREFWDAPGVKEIVFDQQPAIPTFMEIDAESEDDLRRVADALGFDPEKRIVDQDFYNYWYGIPKDRKIPPGSMLTFDDVSQFDSMIVKNQDLFDKTIADQRAYILQHKL